MLVNMHSRNKGERGFTLIELIVVVIVIAVLASIAVPMYRGYIKSVRATEATSRLGAIVTAAKNYYQRNNQWPANFDDEGFYGDDSPTEHFTYDISEGDGFTVVARGRDVHGMSGVTVTAICTNPNAEAVIVVSGAKGP
jgi:prepilin-type N-terminal cleavage/methylation domain-containing protein